MGYVALLALILFLGGWKLALVAVLIGVMAWDWAA